MGLDYKSLEPYGGFDEMLEIATHEGMTLGSAHEDFAHAVHQVLSKGIDPEDALTSSRAPDDHVADEIREGIEALSEQKKAEVREKLGKLFAS